MTIDVAELEAELTRARRKVQDWALSRTKAATERKDQHVAHLQDQTCKASHLQAHKQQLRSATDNNKKRLALEKEELQRLEDDLSAATLQSGTAESRADSARTQLHKQQEQYRQRLTELESGQKQKQKQVESCRRALGLFADRFAMQFRHGQDELCLVLTHVDAFDHSREFCLSVRIDDNTYNVTKCEPGVPGMGELVAEVNRTNEFAAFVKGVRAAWVRLAKQERGL